MITHARSTAGIKLTFSLDLDRPVSVVGDFNDWNPSAHPLKPRPNGRRSVVVTLPAGARYAFRYLADGGDFFDDPQADVHEDNGYGGTHGVVVLDVPAAPAKAATRKPATEPTAKRTTRPTAGAAKAAAKPAARPARKPKG